MAEEGEEGATSKSPFSCFRHTFASALATWQRFFRKAQSPELSTPPCAAIQECPEGSSHGVATPEPATGNVPQKDPSSSPSPVLRAPKKPVPRGSSSRNSRNVILRALDLLKGFRIGSDLRSLQLPPQLLLPKSELQLSGECLYNAGEDLLAACAPLELNPNLGKRSALERMVAVVRWYLTTNREALLLSPFSPLLGETHHVTRGSCSFLLEQVEQNPPTTALYATNGKQKLRVLEYYSTITRFYGSWMEAELRGQTSLFLDEFGEQYTSTFPRLCIRFLPPSSSWIGPISIICAESGYEARLEYKAPRWFAPNSSKNEIKGRIIESGSGSTLLELYGRFDEKVKVKDVRTGEESEFYDYRKALKNEAQAVISEPEALAPMESARLWAALKEAILDERWEDASNAQSEVENKRLQKTKERKAAGVKFVPEYFMPTKEGGWVWKKEDKLVLESPIVVLPVEETNSVEAS